MHSVEDQRICLQRELAELDRRIGELVDGRAQRVPPPRWHRAARPLIPGALALMFFAWWLQGQEWVGEEIHGPTRLPAFAAAIGLSLLALWNTTTSFRKVEASQDAAVPDPLRQSEDENLESLKKRRRKLADMLNRLG